MNSRTHHIASIWNTRVWMELWISFYEWLCCHVKETNGKLPERHPVHMQHISLPRDLHIHMDADEVAVRFSVTLFFCYCWHVPTIVVMIIDGLQTILQKARSSSKHLLVIRKLKTDLVASSKHCGDRTLLGETLRKKNWKIFRCLPPQACIGSQDYIEKIVWQG